MSLQQQQQPQQTQATSASTSKFVSKLGAGAVAGIVGVLIVYPLDMVKTRLQNQKIDAAGKLQYKGGPESSSPQALERASCVLCIEQDEDWIRISEDLEVNAENTVDCFRQVVAKEGVRGLYRGIGPNLVGITPEKAIKLAVNDFVREYLAEKTNVPEEKLAIQYGMIAGATAGFCQVIATNPMEITKIQMQVAGTQKLQPGEKRPTAMSIVRSLGLRGLYKGTPATLLRDVPFSILFFPLNSYLKLKGADENGKVSFPTIFGAGIVAGVVAASAVTPADVIKTRLQVAHRPGEPVFKGISDCFQHIVRNEGASALFKGVVPRSLIVAPMFAIALFVYELQQRFFGPAIASTGAGRSATTSPVLMLSDKK
ncbi:hypothetical protein BGW38_003818 [Lunasporangiospora selenospora]|uniref:Uncharacterized protein n=1 Tax=Lunasporangiospora selenospora TaxID=979761 RepID=A0A9P6G3P0_9FUNG|nr:hypothetical protein BGW38_003818 [Lunasporangiospora selenospora]